MPSGSSTGLHGTKGQRARTVFHLPRWQPHDQGKAGSRGETGTHQGWVDSRQYSGHSFRSGAATTAAQQGVEDATIKMLGRWKSGAYQQYIQTPREQLAAISKKLSRDGAGPSVLTGKSQSLIVQSFMYGVVSLVCLSAFFMMQDAGK